MYGVCVTGQMYILILHFRQILSRSKPAAGGGANSGESTSPLKEKKKKKLPKLEDFLQNRDYAGALTLLEVRSITPCNPIGQIWVPGGGQVWPTILRAFFSYNISSSTIAHMVIFF